MDPATLAQQATYILVPALSALCIAGKPVVDKGKEVLVTMIYEKAFEKLGSESGKRAQALLEKISPKMGASLEKVLTKVSRNPDDPKAKGELQQEILKLLKENRELAREIELIVNVNIDIDVVKQLILGDNNIILNLEGVKGEELIKIMEYMDWKRQEELKQDILKSYSPSALPDYSENLVKFVTENRAEELSSALQHLQKNKILLFSGIAGVGKTTLSRVLVNFRPTGVPEPFWFNFYHHRDAKLEDVLEELAAYLEIPEVLSFKGKRQAGNTDINRLTEELRRRDSLWLVFDDLSYIIDEEQNFIDLGLGLLFEALRDNIHNAKVILTSRVMPLLDNGEYLIDELEDENKQQIRGLKQNFAISYLKVNGFESVELKILESLVINIDGHPFSLKLLAGLAKKHTAENILKDLSLFRKHQKDRIKNARFLFDKLVGGEKELLERIAVYRQPEPLEAIKIMFTDSIPVDSVDTLLDKSLLETDSHGNYWLHPLVQEFSSEDLKNKKEAHMLAVKYYLSLPLPENPTKKEDVQSLIEAHYHACNAERIDLAAKILYHSNLCGQLEFWGNFKIIVELCTPLLPHISLERRITPLECHEYFLGILGIACFKLGFAEEAIILIEEALKITRIRGNKKGEANQLGNLGLAYQRLGNHKKSIEYYKQVIEIAKEIGDQRGEGNSYGNLGNAYLELGETELAIINYKNAVQVLGDIGDKRGESSYLSDLGIVYSQIGKMDEGIYFLKQSLDIFKNIGNKIGEKNQHMNMGIAYKNAGMLEKSIECYREALKISTELEDKSGEGDLLENIGNLFLVFGQPEKAVIYYKQSLIIDRETRNKKGEGINLVSLGMSYIALGQLEIAIEFLKQSLAIGKAIEDPRIISFCETKLKELEGSD